MATFTLQWHLTQVCDLLPPLLRPQQPRQHGLCPSRACARPALRVQPGPPRPCPGELQRRQPHAPSAVLRTLPGGHDRGFLVALPAIRRPTATSSAVGHRPARLLPGEPGGACARTTTTSAARAISTEPCGFLDLLRDFGIYRMVMLTLTRENRPGAGPGRTAARSGGPVHLEPAGHGRRGARSPRWSRAPRCLPPISTRPTNPAPGLKDNLFNLLLTERGRPLTGGCTISARCGLQLRRGLPDGEVQPAASPSPIGDLVTQSLLDIWRRPARTDGQCCRTVTCDRCVAAAPRSPTGSALTCSPRSIRIASGTVSRS